MNKDTLRGSVSSIFSPTTPDASKKTPVISVPATPPAEVSEEGKAKQTPIDRPIRVGSGRPSKNGLPGWKDKENYRTTVTFDRSQFEKVYQITLDKKISTKVVLFNLIEIGLREYEAKNGKIIVSDTQNEDSSIEDLF